MNTQDSTSTSLGTTLRRAAATTTLIGLAAGLAAAPAQASPSKGTPPDASAVVAGGVLRITGTNAADRITVALVTPDSVAVDLGGDDLRRFDRGSFRSVSVSLHGGDDNFQDITVGSFDAPMAIATGPGDDTAVGGAGNDVIDGGPGRDLLLGGAGTDLVLAGSGADQVNGGIGTDTEELGSGDDTAAWNPGEGNDTIAGGSGYDTLVFNGANGDELMSLSGSRGRAVLLRNLGNIRMDLDTVERLDLATLGGADSVTVDDLTDTDLAVAEIDLAGTNGAPDARLDTVVVNGTELDDTVEVRTSGGAVEVAGLPARTVITGGDPTDRLEIHTLGGRDRVTVADAARALLDIVVDLGGDQR